MEAELTYHQVIPVCESSHVGQVRRAIQDMANRAHVTEEVGARAALVATEMSTNLLKHSTTGGEIFYRSIPEETGKARGMEIISLDKGRGISNLGRAFNDGYSTAGSPGTGLGAMQRMSENLEVYSADKMGTVIAAQVRSRGPSLKYPPPRIRTMMVPLKGFDVSGDRIVVLRKEHSLEILFTDGLGHGSEAARASEAAAATFSAHCHSSTLPALMELIHLSIVKTRGAAVALVRINTRQRTVNYVAVGNIEARMVTSEYSQGCATLNGTAGLTLPRLVQFDYLLPPEALFIMHSDGLSARWNLRDYPGLNLNSPGAIAGLLFRDFARKRDDATVMVIAT